MHRGYESPNKRHTCSWDQRGKHRHCGAAAGSLRWLWQRSELMDDRSTLATRAGPHSRRWGSQKGAPTTAPPTRPWQRMCSQNGGPTARAPPPRDRPRHSLWAHEAGADRHCDRGCVCTHACVCTFFYFNTRVFYAEIHRDFTGVISFAEMTPVQQTWEKRQKKFH